MKNIVLLVDDDRNVLHGLVRALRPQRYEVYTATSGEEAVLVLKGHRVDVIVSDEHMPGMCGGELLAWVAEHFPEVMRIVLTGRPTVETLIRAINEGAVYQFFTKPCDAVLLGVAIHKALEHKTLLCENRRLLDVNVDQMRELDQYRRDLEILTRLVVRDIQQPLQTVVRHCQALAREFEDLLDPKVASLAENALEAIGEVQQLVNDLLLHCRAREPVCTRVPAAPGAVRSSPIAWATPACCAVASGTPGDRGPQDG